MQIVGSKGPSLPSTIAKEINMDMLFTSAFLSELLSEKKLKTSNLKVGSSCVYFIPGQETQLESFSHHMKDKEKEAYDLLKSRKILKDKNLEPAIRVALRKIRDFAVPFKNDEEIYWKYFTIDNSEVENLFSSAPKQSEKPSEPEIIKKESSEKPKDELGIFEEKEQRSQDNLEQENKKVEEKPKKKAVKKKAARKKASNTKNEKFFNKVKEHLNNNSIEILDFEGFSKSDLKLKIKRSGQEYLLIAYNKKRITEKDILSAHKTAQEKNMKYIILSLGEPAKKIINFIDAVKDLQELDKID